MKVIWFTNTSACSLGATQLKTSGGWMAVLLEKLRDQKDLKLGVVTAERVPAVTHQEVDGVDMYSVPEPSKLLGFGQKRSLEYCRQVIQKWQPDLIHVHGTERFYGLLGARGMAEVPTAVSLQGLLAPYSKWRNYFGDYGIFDVLRMHRAAEPIALRGLYWDYHRFKRAAQREIEIVKSNRFFFGRTLWDRAYVESINPSATYYHVGEMLRGPFWKARWDLDRCRRHRIVFTNAGHPRKGTDVLLEAVRQVKYKFPDTTVAIAGGISTRSGYGKYLRNRLRQLGETVEELGAINAEQMANELATAHVFVSPSLIDNSPNAVCEAQLVGVPVISSYTGGVPTLIQEGKTGLFFPNSDSPTLAARLIEIFSNDELARSLSKQGRELAKHRNSSETVSEQLMDAYRGILSAPTNSC